MSESVIHRLDCSDVLSVLFPCWGDGSDGRCVLDAARTVAFGTYKHRTLVLERDAYLLGGSSRGKEIRLDLNGHRLFCFGDASDLALEDLVAEKEDTFLLLGTKNEGAVWSPIPRTVSMRTRRTE
jgi:hypothetical protein